MGCPCSPLPPQAATSGAEWKLLLSPQHHHGAAATMCVSGAQPSGALKGVHQHSPWLVLQRGLFCPPTPQQILPTPTPQPRCCSASPARAALARCLHSTQAFPQRRRRNVPERSFASPGISFQPLPARPHHRQPPPSLCWTPKTLTRLGGGGGHEPNRIS